MAEANEGEAIRRKRLAYQCAHRGMKEMDLILGSFAARALGTLSGAEMDELEAVLALPDDLLYRWISGSEALPSQHAGAVLGRIITEARGAKIP